MYIVWCDGGPAGCPPLGTEEWVHHLSPNLDTCHNEEYYQRKDQDNVVTEYILLS